MNFISYLRISNGRSGGESSLGIESQRQGIAAYIASLNEPSTILQEYVEIMSGGRNDRPKLIQALQQCQQTKSKLIIFKLDRLSRSASMIFNLQEAKVPFVIATMPEANELTIGFMALMAQYELRQIHDRVVAGLKIARQRGKKLGGLRFEGQIEKMTAVRVANKEHHAKAIYGVIQDIRGSGVNSLTHICDCLNRRGYKSPRGKTYTATGVRRVLMAIEGNGNQILT